MERGAGPGGGARLVSLSLTVLCVAKRRGAGCHTPLVSSVSLARDVPYTEPHTPTRRRQAGTSTRHTKTTHVQLAITANLTRPDKYKYCPSKLTRSALPHVSNPSETSPCPARDGPDGSLPHAASRRVVVRSHKEEQRLGAAQRLDRQERGEARLQRGA